MNPPASVRHPFKALVAIAATFAVVHGVCAHADTREPQVGRIDIVGQLPLHEACLDLGDDELADELSADTPPGR